MLPGPLCNSLCLSFLFSVYKCPDDYKFSLAIAKVSMPQYKSISGGFRLLPLAGFHPRPSSLMQQQVLLTASPLYTCLLLSAAVRFTYLALAFGCHRCPRRPKSASLRRIEHHMVGLCRYPCRPVAHLSLVSIFCPCPSRPIGPLHPLSGCVCHSCAIACVSQHVCSVASPCVCPSFSSYLW